MLCKCYGILVISFHTCITLKNCCDNKVVILNFRVSLIEHVKLIAKRLITITVRRDSGKLSLAYCTFSRSTFRVVVVDELRVCRGPV